MKKIDITERIINIRSQKNLQEQQLLASKKMPTWLQAPFDEYYANSSEKNLATNTDTPGKQDNVMFVDFSHPKFEIPKMLAAANVNHTKKAWYEAGSLSFKDANDATIQVLFNKPSDQNNIDIMISVLDGESVFLQQYAGVSNLECSLFDDKIAMASLMATVNEKGNLMHAEGKIIRSTEPKNGAESLTLYFHQQE